MKIKIKSIQTMDNKKEVSEQIGRVTVNQYEKGMILSWNIPNQPFTYHMTILENKILLKNENQNMTFELAKSTKGTIQTPYGNLNINITTKHMEVLKKEDMISKIHLIYEISIEGTPSYQNEIEIIIQE